jgi:hypothetical protein
MIQCKHQLASTHATATGTFANGAYLTDPLRFVSVLCAQSSLLVVGGDAGGGHTKLGVTYTAQGVQCFTPFIVYDGKDNYEMLHQLTQPSLTPFIGDSASFPHIFAILQHLIDTKQALANGDWPFLSAILGLQGHSSAFPCPICTVFHKGLLLKKPYRKAGDNHSVKQDQPPLLSIPADRIVPTPLHLYLGINNRIIFEVFSELLGEESILQAVGKVRTIHTAGCGGLADVHQMNGPELARWIKQNDWQALVDESSQSLSKAAAAKIKKLFGWMEILHKYLLHDRDWEATDLFVFRAFLDDIYKNWRRTSGQEPFPKLHMLRHAVEFAERHKFLGRASEAQIESFHAQFNDLFHNHHHNQAHNPPERLRCCLADVALRAVQPVVNE